MTNPEKKSKRGLGGMSFYEEDKKDYSQAGRSLPKEYLSFSQINLYQSCPKAYEYRYIYDAVSPAVPIMVQGKAVHAALEANYEQKITTKDDITADEMIDAFNTEARKGFAELDKITKSDKTRIENDSAEFIRGYRRHYCPSVQPISVEDRFTIDLTETVQIMGFIDLVQEEKQPIHIVETKATDKAELSKYPNRKKVIVDHKVTTRKKPQNDTDSSLQLSIYSMATKVPNVRFDALIVSPKKEIKAKTEVELWDKKILQTVSQRTKADLEFHKSVILTIADSISSGNFPKLGSGTWKCSLNFCPHYKKCHDN